jgi:enoyl-CoA hydratase
MTEKLVRVEIDAAGVAVLTLDRPPVNAMSRAIREQFLHAMDDLGGRDDVRAIVLTATGKVFCAGADIKEKKELADSDVGAYARADRLTRDTFLALVESPKPVLAAVNGAALGAGFVMAACCDFILASDDAFFAMPEIDVGQGGGASFLQRILPSSRMRRMMLTGERVPARELYRLGVIEECLAREELLPAAVGLARKIAAKSPTAVRAIRNSFQTVAHLPLYEGFRLEQRYTTALSLGEDAHEARAAFIEKRVPDFSRGKRR